MDEFAIGDAVRVDLAGRVVGKSEFEEPAYLVEYESAGRLQREWVVADKLVMASGKKMQKT